MKYILSLTMLFALLSCTAQNQQGSQEGIYTDVSNAEAKTLMDERPDLQIIDVRTDDEVAAGKIKGSRQIDISDPSFAKQLETLDKSAPVLVYCAGGVRSKTAQERMKALGFEEVHNLEKGYSGWK